MAKTMKEISDAIKVEVKLFINVSNHPMKGWSQEQLKAATVLGKDGTAEVQFPQVGPEWSKQDIRVEAVKVYNLILSRIADWMDKHPLSATLSSPKVTVHLMGEQSLSFCLANLLLDKGFSVVVSTTERKTVETTLPDGSTKKEANFQFVKFRELIRQWK